MLRRSLHADHSRSKPAASPHSGTGTQAPIRRPTKAQLHEAHHTERARLRAAEDARRRHRRGALWGGGGLAATGLVLTLVVTMLGGASPGRPSSTEVMPAPIAAGVPDVQPAALVVKNTSGIPGVVAYDTTGWPADRSDGPAARALGHVHVPGPVTYSVTPPVGGDHNAVWLDCGVYDKPVPNERAVHDLEHGAVWITYRPSLTNTEIDQLRAFETRQRVVGSSGSRYVDLSPYPGLTSPIVISSWGFQLRVDSPNDPRLQRFVDTFRASPRYAPELGGACTGGAGTPLHP